MKTWLLLSPILVLISACGPNKESHEPRLPRSTASDSAFTDQVTRTVEPDRQLMALLNESQVSCEGPCPEAVGYLIAWGPGDKPNKIMRTGCTSFLIAPDIMATNSHCIPDEIKSRPELCAQQIGFKLPETSGKGTEQLVCSQLIHFSKIPQPEIDEDGKPVVFPQNPDYAYVRVSKKSSRNPFTISRSGVKDGATLSVYGADPVGDKKFSATIRKRSCFTKQKRVNYYMHDYSDIIFSFGKTCGFVHGDSGSPALNESGQVAAIFFAFSTKQGKKTEEDAQKLSRSIVRINPEWNYASYFTNLSCLDFPRGVNVSAKPLQCANIETLNNAAQAELDAYELQLRNADEAKDMMPWLAQRPRVIYDKPKIDGKEEYLTTLYKFELKCLLPQQVWETLEQKPSVDGDKLTVKYNEMASKYQLEVDPELRMQQKKISDKVIRHEIEINISDVKKEVSVVGTHKVDGKSSPFSTRWCGEGDYKKTQ